MTKAKSEQGALLKEKHFHASEPREAQGHRQKAGEASYLKELSNKPVNKNQGHVS